MHERIEERIRRSVGRTPRRAEHRCDRREADERVERKIAGPRVQQPRAGHLARHYLRRAAGFQPENGRRVVDTRRVEDPSQRSARRHGAERGLHAFRCRGVGRDDGDANPGRLELADRRRSVRRRKTASADEHEVRGSARRRPARRVQAECARPAGDEICALALHLERAGRWRQSSETRHESAVRANRDLIVGHAGPQFDRQRVRGCLRAHRRRQVDQRSPLASMLECEGPRRAPQGTMDSIGGVALRARHLHRVPRDDPQHRVRRRRDGSHERQRMLGTGRRGGSRIRVEVR